MWKSKINFKIEPNAHQWSSRRWPHGHQKVNGRWSQDSLSSGGDWQDPRRSPPGLRTIVTGTPAWHWPKILSFPDRISRWLNSLPAAAGQATAGWLYDIVQGQENWPMSYRSRKIGIRQKSSGHRWIRVQLGRCLKQTCMLHLLVVYVHYDGFL